MTARHTALPWTRQPDNSRRIGAVENGQPVAVAVFANATDAAFALEAIGAYEGLRIQIETRDAIAHSRERRFATCRAIRDELAEVVRKALPFLEVAAETSDRAAFILADAKTLIATVDGNAAIDADRNREIFAT